MTAGRNVASALYTTERTEAKAPCDGPRRRGTMATKQTVARFFLLCWKPVLPAATILAWSIILMGPRSPQAAAGAPTPSQKPIVVVELFTAEGCSSCPPADELLAKMAGIPLDDISIVPLGFHVTYWNDGWKD